MNKKSNPLFKAIIFLVIMFAAFSIFSVFFGNDFVNNKGNTTTISQAYKEDKITSVEITPKNNVYEVKATLKEVPGQKEVVLRENVITQTEIEEIAKKAQSKNVPVKVNPEPEPSNMGSFIFTILLFGGLFFLMSRMLGGKNSPMNAGENKARLSSGSLVKFTDVIGYEEEKQELVEVIEFLKNPSLFLEMGATIPRGILLEGPPGTGKTLMAKAVAGEAGVPFYSISGSDFIEMFVGVGASRVRNLFKEAKKTGSCIVFIDEIDAIGSRDSGAPGGRNTEQEQTINALLVELDGFATNNDKGQVIILVLQIEQIN